MKINKIHFIYIIILFITASANALPSYYPKESINFWSFFSNDDLALEASEDWDDGVTTAYRTGGRINRFTLGMEALLITLRGNSLPQRNDAIIIWSDFNIGALFIPLLNKVTFSAGLEFDFYHPLGGLFIQEQWHALVGVPRPIPREYVSPTFEAGINLNTFITPDIFPVSFSGNLYIGFEGSIIPDGTISLTLPPEIFNARFQYGIKDSRIKGEIYFQDLYFYKELGIKTMEQDGGMGIVLGQDKKESSIPLRIIMGMPIFYHSYMVKFHFGGSGLKFLFEWGNGFISGEHLGPTIWRHAQTGAGVDWTFLKPIKDFDLYTDLCLGLRKEKHHTAEMDRSQILKQTNNLYIRSAVGARYFLPFSFKRIGIDLAFNLRASLPGKESPLPVEYFGSFACIIEQ